MSRTPIIATKVQALVNRHEGMASSEHQAHGLSELQARKALERLVAAGTAHAARTSDRRFVRYFGSPERAAEYGREQEAARARARFRSADVGLAWSASKQERLRKGALSPLGRAPWAPDAEPHFPIDDNGVPLWRHTVCPPSVMGLWQTNTHSEVH